MDATTDRLQALRGMSVEALASLLRRVPGLVAALEGHGPLVGWLRYGVPRSRGAPDLELVARVLASPAGIEATLDALSLTELQLVLLARWEGGVLDRERALAQAGATRDAELAQELDRAAAGLAGLLVSAAERGWVALRGDVAVAVALPGVTLAEGLQQVQSEAIARRLRALGVASSAIPPRKAERTDLLVAALRDPTVVGPLVAGLPGDQAHLLERLSQDGLVAVRDLGVPWYAGYRSRYQPESPLYALVELGLVGVDEVQQLAFLWLDVAVALHGGRLFTAWPPRPAPSVRPLQQTVTAVPPVMAQLERLLDAWGADPSPALSDGALGVRPVRAVARTLGLQPGVVGLLAGLAISLGLLGTVRQGVVGRGRQRREVVAWAPTAAAEAWRAFPAPERWARLVAAWLDSELVDERGGLPERCDPAGRESGARAAREALLSLLEDQAPAHGLQPVDLQAVAAFERPRVLGDATDGLVAAARTLGLVPAAGPVGLTDLARALLADGPEAVQAALPAPSRTFVVQADHTVVAPPDLEPAVAVTLERYAELESDAGARVFRLTERRLGQALAGGDDGEAIAAFLVQHSRAEVPQNVAYLVADCARRHGRLRAGACASYVRSDDPGLLTAAAAVRAARLRVLAPTVAVSSLPLDKVVAALAGRGVVALPEDTTGAALVRETTAADPHWRVDLDPRPPRRAALRPGLAALRETAGRLLRGEEPAPNLFDDAPSAAVARLLARQALLDRFEDDPDSLELDELDEVFEVLDLDVEVP